MHGQKNINISQNLLLVTDNGKTKEVFEELPFRHSNIRINYSVTKGKKKSQILLHLMWLFRWTF